jgi:hypothetical protein
MKRSSALLATVAVGLMLGIAALDAQSQRRPATKRAVTAAKPKLFECTKRIITADWLTLMRSVNETNPGVVNLMFTDADVRKGQVDNMRELLAIACEAVRDRIAETEPYKAELANISLEVTAVEFDKFKHPSTDRSPFENITSEQIAAFYKVPGNEIRFNEFLATKVALLELDDLPGGSRPVTDEERAQARDQFARMSIVVAEKRSRTSGATAEFNANLALMIKLQQAQFLARSYGQKVAVSYAVSEAEVAAYIAGKPELSIQGKRARANEVLRRALAGEDFASLADQFSEDPGNRDGEKMNGGAYLNVPKGRMITEFEKAALALEPGKIYSELVETDYGFHVIKLDRIGDRADPEMTYDVRHILISTVVSDPDDPGAGEMPVKDFVRNKLESEKESKNIDRIIAANPIEIAAIPTAFPPAAKPAAKPVKPKR